MWLCSCNMFETIHGALIWCTNLKPLNSAQNTGKNPKFSCQKADSCSCATERWQKRIKLCPRTLQNHKIIHDSQKLYKITKCSRKQKRDVVDDLIYEREISLPTQIWQWGYKQGVVGSEGVFCYMSNKRKIIGQDKKAIERGPWGRPSIWGKRDNKVGTPMWCMQRCLE